MHEINLYLRGQYKQRESQTERQVRDSFEARAVKYSNKPLQYMSFLALFVLAKKA